MLLKPKQADEYLRCSVSTLNRLRRTVDGPPFYKRVGRVFYDTDDLNRWWKEGERASTAAGVTGRRPATILRSECKQITIRAVRALEAGTLLDDDGQPVDRLTDRAIPCFFARRLPSGRVSFGFQYGPRHRRRFKSLGLFGPVTVDQAREAARRYGAKAKPTR